PNPFDLDGSRPLPLVDRARVAEVRERLRADGGVDTPLDEGSVRDAVGRLAGRDVEGLVISFLHAYRNPAHERRAQAVAEAAAPGLPVSISADVWPQAREYERTALAVLDAYVQPRVRRYLEGFEQALAAQGVRATPLITKSNGGIMPVTAARRQTVATLLSGPASGVIGAAYVAAAAGLPNVITLDVGGTSADIAVVEDGRPRSSTSAHIGGRPAGDDAGRGGRERGPGGRVEHVRGVHQDPLASGSGPARLRPRRLRRRRTGRRRAPGPRGRYSHGLRSTLAGHAVRAGRPLRGRRQRRGAHGARGRGRRVAGDGGA